MFKKLNFKSRRLFLIISFFVLLISLSACSSAGSPYGKLPVDEVYTSAGKYTVTKGELWNELKWTAKDILTEKITEVVMKDYVQKVSLVMDKSFSDLTNDEKSSIEENLTEERFGELRSFYSERLEDYVIEDIYNFSFSPKNSYEEIESVEKYDAKKLILKYSDEIYTQYNLKEINGKPFHQFCTEAVEKRENYLTIAKQLKNLYYQSLAKELLAYAVLEEDVKDAYDNRDTDNEDDLGYFTKNEYTSKFKAEFANQADLNLVLIHFSSEAEYTSTLRSFGLKEYKKNLVFIPKPDSVSNFAEYCDYYDKLTTSDLEAPGVYQRLNTLTIAQIYIQMYNYLYGGYRNYIYDESYVSNFDSVEKLINITSSIRDKSGEIEDQEAEIKKISDALIAQKDNYDVDTLYTREEIDDIDSSFSTYLYETLSLPLSSEKNEDDDSLCYSTSVQTYNSSYWIAFKFSQGEDKYEDIYNKNTVDDDLYESIAKDTELKAEIEKLLKQDKITQTAIDSAVKERTDSVAVSIYDEALEISYATGNSNYSKTYGSAPNPNVLATLKYDNKTWNLNIVEDTTDENALLSGAYDILEARSGVTTAIDILSRKVVKNTKSYADTAKDIDTYKDSVEYVLTAFSNDYYASSGYSSSIGKYNFMMLYFHTANIDEIIDNTYRINAAAAKLLTNYNSDQLLDFFKSYSDNIYNNYFSISGKRLVVYRDADDDSEKDDVTEWTESQKRLAQQLVYEIYNELASTTGSHSEALSNIISEINTSARAQFEDNPIAPENKWANYRKAGLNVELIDIEAKNDTTSIDFKLKERMLEIFKSDSYSINQTTPTEYLEDLRKANENPDMILQTKDGYNLLLITSADFQTSAEFKEESDKEGVFKDISVYYNEEYCKIGNVYNDEKQVSKEQIRLYVLEYVSSSTSNLSPSAISSALTNFLSPVITRYTGTETQRDVIIYLIEKKAGALNFGSEAAQERYNNILEINHNTADDYISVYFEEDKTDTLKTYENWWKDLQKIVGEILLNEGEDA